MKKFMISFLTILNFSVSAQAVEVLEIACKQSNLSQIVIGNVLKVKNCKTRFFVPYGLQEISKLDLYYLKDASYYQCDEKTKYHLIQLKWDDDKAYSVPKEGFEPISRIRVTQSESAEKQPTLVTTDMFFVKKLVNGGVYATMDIYKDHDKYRGYLRKSHGALSDGKVIPMSCELIWHQDSSPKELYYNTYRSILKAIK